MNKQLQRASSMIADHYGLRWLGNSLTLRKWESVGSLNHLFFVSVWMDKTNSLYLIDRKEIDVMDEGMRLKVPCFFFSPTMVNHLERMGHQVWYVVVGDELIYIRDRHIERLFKRINIKTGDDSRHKFEQEYLGLDIEIKLSYLPRRGKVKKNSWKQHLKPVRKTLLEPTS